MMNVPHRILISIPTLCLLLNFLGAANGQSAYTLEECIQLGLERSIPLANARRDLVIAQMDIDVVGAVALPTLDLQANYTRLDDTPSFPEFPGMAGGSIGQRNTYAASVDAEQLLYSGGSVQAAKRIAVDYEDAAKRELERIKSDLIRRITHGFYDVLYREQALTVAADSVQQWEAFEEQVRRRYDAQTASEFEWLSAQVTLANERPVLIAASNALTLTRRAFRDLILLDQPDYRLSGTLDALDDWPTHDALVQHAVDHRPELLQAQAQYRVALEMRRVTIGGYLPEIRAFASYGGADPSQRDFLSDGWQWEWMAGLRVQWSLYDGGKRRAELRQNEMAIEQTRDIITDLTRATALEVEQIWLMQEELRETLKSTADNMALAERALEIVTVRHAQGMATQLEFTDSQLALQTARLNHVRTLVALHKAWADMQHVTAWRADRE